MNLTLLKIRRTMPMKALHMFQEEIKFAWQIFNRGVFFAKLRFLWKEILLFQFFFFLLFLFFFFFSSFSSINDVASII